MQLALTEAENAADKGEVPVGAVLISDDELLASSGNAPISLNDPTAHAEILTLRAAAQITSNYRLPGTTLYVTLEPCIMCMGAMIHSRIERLVYGATDPKTGAAHSLYQLACDTRLNHQFEIAGGILEKECGDLLREFFRRKRR